MTTVAVIGAGVMGHSLALVFAMGSCKVTLHDISEAALEQARRLIASSIDVLREAGLCGKEQALAATDAITFTTDLAATSQAELVIEAISENRELKRDVYERLDGILATGAIIASNTSFLNIFELMPAARQSTAVIAHWYTPPHIVDLVEIVPGPQTSAATVTTLRDLLQALGKKPIVMRQFISGFIANRLQAALSLEAYFLLDNGYATAEEIDDAMKHGLALRMPFLGQFRRVDFAGLALAQKALANRTYEPPPVRGRSDVLDDLVSRGRTGVMSGSGFYDYGARSPEELFRERDRKLLALKKLLAELGEIA